MLRGLAGYEPRRHQINLAWHISHPDKVADAELEAYDHVFVASEPHAEALAARLRVPVTALLQCTDPERFNPDVAPDERHELLFVGNSRNVRRAIVQDAIEAGLPLSVFGARWDGLIPPRHLKGAHIPNERLAAYYRAAGVVLNDHWDAMRRHGFLSNRLFDAAACGARIVSDPVPGLERVFGGLVAEYDGPTDLRAAVERLREESPAEGAARLARARQVMEQHSFDARARSLMAVVLEHDRSRNGVMPAAL